jgi:hypothetical protein
VFRDQGKAKAYMWKGDQWDEFGEVMDNAGNDSSNVGAV